jgi:pimeloyl-ACP methyl ester carboxylesterase
MLMQRLCFAVGFLLLQLLSVRAEPIIWLAPLSSVTFDNKPGAADYMSLFQPDASWQQVAKVTSVFKIYPTFAGRASDDILRAVFADLKRRGMALALEARILSSTVSCTMKHGDGGEATINIIRRLRWLGADLRYIAMDEPMKHGLLGKENCRAAFDTMADDVATNIKAYRAFFPNLQFGAIEPIGDWPKILPNLLSNTLQWVDAYERRTGEKLAFFHVDVGWKTNWLPINLALRKQLKQRGIPFGIIYNSDDPPTSDQQWATSTAEHYQAFERMAEPDQVIFQTWRSFPTKVLPEEDPLSLTGVVKGYLNYRATNKMDQRDAR